LIIVTLYNCFSIEKLYLDGKQVLFMEFYFLTLEPEEYDEPDEELYKIHYELLKKLIERIKKRPGEGPIFITLPEFAYAFIDDKDIEKEQKKLINLLKKINRPVFLSLNALIVKKQTTHPTAQQFENMLEKSGTWGWLITNNNKGEVNMNHKTGFGDGLKRIYKFYKKRNTVADGYTNDDCFTFCRKKWWYRIYMRTMLALEEYKIGVCALTCSDLMNESFLRPQKGWKKVYLAPAQHLSVRQMDIVKRQLKKQRDENILVAIMDPFKTIGKTIKFFKRKCGVFSYSKEKDKILQYKGVDIGEVTAEISKCKIEAEVYHIEILDRSDLKEFV
jgi:hypothetical protein